MLRSLNLPVETESFNTSSFHRITTESPKLLHLRKSFSFFTENGKFQKKHGLTICSSSPASYSHYNEESFSQCIQADNHDDDEDEEEEGFPYVQTLAKFPKQLLLDKLVMLRFDAAVLLDERHPTAVYTVKYLHRAGAKLILVGDWGRRTDSNAELVADILQSILALKVVSVPSVSSGRPIEMEMLEKADAFLLENLSEFKEEAANCSKFAKLLSSGVDVFVNDAFSLSHKILASTVGVTQFCSTCLAGFYFEECLSQIKNAVRTNKKPFFAIIGGGNIHDKLAALRFLASRCDGMIFVGMMSFQIMHALGYPVPSNLIEPGGHEAALDIIQFARDRSIPITFPKDFWCINDHVLKHMEIVPANNLMAGWLPVDIGPKSVDEINSLLTKCKKILWIGPLKLKSSISVQTNGASKVVQILDDLSQRNCDVNIVGKMESKSAIMGSNSLLCFNIISHASVVWEFFKGRKLHGFIALDRAYPFEIDWNSVYYDPTKPLAVDIGSGNGLFLLGMTRRRNDLNFLGIEINRKLVRRCMDAVRQFGLRNGYFVAANATSTFRSIVSSYPGELVLVSIQCPNPDFNNPDHRWRMLQKSLVEAVADLLAHGGKIFLQSDIEAVAIRMKDLFLKHSDGNLCIWNDKHQVKYTKGMWLEENPFGVRSDWEQHVLDRGAPMFRLMLSKSSMAEQEFE